MEYEYELTLVVRTKTEQKTHPSYRWDFHSVDKVVDTKLISLLAQFNIVLASVYKKILEEYSRETGVIDDDIPF